MRRFEAFLTTQGMPLDVPHIRRERVETFLADLHTRYQPATVANRYRALKVFFQWSVPQGERSEEAMWKARLTGGRRSLAAVVEAPRSRWPARRR